MRHQAIYNTHPNVKGIINEGVCIDKDSNPVVIDEAKVALEEKKLQDAYDALAYSRARQAEYPDYGTQLNKIYDDGLTKWKSEMVDPIKAKWPKDNSGPK